jgi:hypothetical protein
MGTVLASQQCPPVSLCGEQAEGEHDSLVMPLASCSVRPAQLVIGAVPH